MLPSQAVKALVVHPGRSRVAQRLAEFGEASAKAERIIRGDEDKVDSYVRRLLASMMGIDRRRDKVQYKHVLLVATMVLNKLIDPRREDFHIVRPADFGAIAHYIGMSECYDKEIDFFETFDMGTYYDDLTSEDLSELRVTAERAARRKSTFLVNLVLGTAMMARQTVGHLTDLVSRIRLPVTTAVHLFVLLAILKLVAFGINKALDKTLNTLINRFSRDYLCKHLKEVTQPDMQRIDGLLMTDSNRLRDVIDRSLDLKRRYIKAGIQK
jgi:hypothetical protein